MPKRACSIVLVSAFVIQSLMLLFLLNPAVIAPIIPPPIDNMPDKLMSTPKQNTEASLVLPDTSLTPPASWNTNTSCGLWGVTTTIFEPSPAIFQFLQDSDACLVVVGDRKTNHSAWKEFVALNAGRGFYLSPADQARLPLATVALLPWNHFGRKNIGYLFVCRHGGQMIYDFDDDNTLRSAETLFAQIVQGRLDNISVIRRQHHVFNPYPGFDPVDSASKQQFLWPRGFPLNFIHDPLTFALDPHMSVDQMRVAVFQSLANNDPDVDAVFRMTRQLPISFSRENTIRAVPRGTFSPWNSQAVLVRNVAFWGLLLPITVTGRVSDIWRSYITSRLLFLTPYLVAFTSPFVDQYRNPHDYQVDLSDEQDLFLKTNDMLKVLAEFSFDKASAFPDKLIQVFDALRQCEIVGDRDTQLARAWVHDLNSLQYVWPSTIADFPAFTPTKGPVFDFRRFSLPTAVRVSRAPAKQVPNSTSGRPAVVRDLTGMHACVTGRNPEDCSRRSKLIHLYNNSNCVEVKAVVVTRLQRTGLGSSQFALSMGAATLAQRGVVVIFKDYFDMPYLVCDDGRTGFACVYQRSTRCAIHEIPKANLCFVDAVAGYPHRKMRACPLQGKRQIAFTYRDLAMHLYQLNKATTDKLSRIRKFQHWPAHQDVLSIHVRQGVSNGHWDHVRRHSHVWSSSDITTVSHLLCHLHHANAVLVLSDDIGLIKDVEVKFRDNNYTLFEYSTGGHGLKMRDTGVRVTTPHLMTTTRWAYNPKRIAHRSFGGGGGGGSQDCLREQTMEISTLCKAVNKTELKLQAFSAIIDNHLPAYTQHFAGTFRSSFTRTLSDRVPSMSPRVNLDAMWCDQVSDRQFCFLKILKQVEAGVQS